MAMVCSSSHLVSGWSNQRGIPQQKWLVRKSDAPNLDLRPWKWYDLVPVQPIFCSDPCWEQAHAVVSTPPTSCRGAHEHAWIDPPKLLWVDRARTPWLRVGAATLGTTNFDRIPSGSPGSQTLQLKIPCKPRLHWENQLWVMVHYHGWLPG